MKLEEMYDLSDFPYASLAFSVFHLSMENFQDFCFPCLAIRAPSGPHFNPVTSQAMPSVPLGRCQWWVWHGGGSNREKFHMSWEGWNSTSLRESKMSGRDYLPFIWFLASRTQNHVCFWDIGDVALTWGVFQFYSFS